MRYQEKTKRIVVVPGVLAVETNVIDMIPGFILGHFIHETFTGETKVDLGFEVVRDVIRPTVLDTRFENFYGHHDIPSIYYEKKLSKRISFKMLVEQTTKGYNVKVNRRYFKYCRFKIDRMYPPGAHLQDLVITCLSALGFSVLHGACVSKDNVGNLLLACSNTGKSLTAYESIKRGYNFLSEDMLVVDTDYAYASPLISCRACQYRVAGHQASFFDKSSPRLLKKIFLTIFQSLPGWSGVQLKNKPFENFLTSGIVIPKTRLNNIVLLERGGDDLIEIEQNAKEDFLQKISIMNRGEFSYYHNPLLRALLYFNTGLAIENIIKTQQDVLSSIIKRSRCFVFRSSEPRQFINYLDMINDKSAID